MRIRTSSTNESAGDHFWKTALITCESNYSAGLGCPGWCLHGLHSSHPILNCQHLPASQQLGLIKQIWSWTSLNSEHRDSGRLGGQYIHNSLNASRQIKLKTFPDSPPGSFWRKEACRFPHKMCFTKTFTSIKYHFFLLINHFSRPHWQLSSLFLIITFQNMFPF